LPGTSGFVGEFLSLLGAYQVSTVFAAFATTGIILGAAYMLVLYRGVVFGPRENKDALAMPDVNGRELFCLVPLALLVLFLGVAPGYVMDRVGPSVEKLRTQYEAGLLAMPVPLPQQGGTAR
jgi:NADH-quinone oxidoreductase subunit M